MLTNCPTIDSAASSMEMKKVIFVGGVRRILITPVFALLGRNVADEEPWLGPRVSWLYPCG
jgi:hypothetical protein